MLLASDDECNDIRVVMVVLFENTVNSLIVGGRGEEWLIVERAGYERIVRPLNMILFRVDESKRDGRVCGDAESNVVLECEIGYPAGWLELMRYKWELAHPIPSNSDPLAVGREEARKAVSQEGLGLGFELVKDYVSPGLGTYRPS